VRMGLSTKRYLRAGMPDRNGLGSASGITNDLCLTFGLEVPTDVAKYYHMSSFILGVGGFSTVRVAQRRSDGSHWAAKIVKTEGLAEDVQQQLMEELHIMRLVGHPCLLRLEEAFEQPQETYMVLELMEGGDLAQRLEEGPIPPREVLHVATSLASGMAHLHSTGVLHRDLKPENCLFESFQEGAAVKVSDFGLATRIGDGAVSDGLVHGSPTYLAPEVLSRYSYALPSDVWSFGVLLYEASTGRLPASSSTLLYCTDGQEALRMDTPFKEHDAILEPIRSVVAASLIEDATIRQTFLQLADIMTLFMKEKLC